MSPLLRAARNTKRSITITDYLVAVAAGLILAYMAFSAI